MGSGIGAGLTSRNVLQAVIPGIGSPRSRNSEVNISIRFGRAITFRPSEQIGCQMSPPFLPVWKRGFAVPDFSTRSAERELLDEPVHDQRELDANLRDIRRINTLLGATSTTLRHLPHLLDIIPAGQPVMILDLAPGSGDIPLPISRIAARRKQNLHIIA